MTRMMVTMAALGWATCLAVPAAAQSQVPIARDLQRLERTDRPTGYDVDATGLSGHRRAAEPFGGWQDPSGIPGFNGPPGTYGDSVGSYSPLPPGAPGNETDW